MNFTRSLLFRTFQSFHRYNCPFSKYAPIVKVLCLEDDNIIKLTFKYSHSHNLIVRAPKEENVQSVLARIKLMANLQRKKEEIRQAVIDRHANTTRVALEASEEDIDVCLFENDNFVDENISNIDAWAQASQLKIGDTVYDIKFNVPSVVSLTLPDCILSRCSLRPRFRLECANLEDSRFSWYRSQPREKVMELLNIQRTDGVLIEDDKCWLKICDGFIYTTSSEDIGCFLKIVCTPRRGDCEGIDYSVESTAPVEASPDKFPFEERQAHTSSITSEDSIRCVSYNTLANSYVERRKFPYCSERARNHYYRKQLLFRELAGYQSDILCLQEVEERVFNCDFIPILKECGFDGYYKKKGGRRYEGLATFIRSSKFKLVQNCGVLMNEIIYEDFYKDLRAKLGGSNRDTSLLLKQDSAIQVLLLEHIENPNHKLIVANTHLYSNKNTPEVRLIQAAVCTNYVEHIIQTQAFNSAAVLFCGDFNSVPSSDTFDFMTSGKCCPTWKNNASTNVDTTLLHNLHLDSACGTPEYTNYTEDFNGCLDYIFYSKEKLEVTDVVPMPKHEDVIANIGLPNECFPSDHIALVCTLKWKDS